MNTELQILAKKAADQWRNTDEYNQAAVIIDLLLDRLAAYGDSDSTSEKIAALKEQTRWISVNERLPEPGIQKILVYVQSEHVCVIDMARYLGEKGFDLVSWKLWDNCVTHWMPLPEAPKEADNADS